MTAHQTPADGSTGAIACSLGPTGLMAQASRWVRLTARAMTSRASTADGLRISFRPEPGTEDELRALVAVENECCPWASWTVASGDGELVLDVRSASADGAATLHTLFNG